MSRQRARLIHRSRRGDEIHQVRASPIRPDRQPAADDLAEHGQIRTHAVERLGSAGCDAKSRDDLIEDEERASPFGQLAQSF